MGYSWPMHNVTWYLSGTYNPNHVYECVYDIPAWISNYTHYKVWREITYPVLNFNGATVEV